MHDDFFRNSLNCISIYAEHQALLLQFILSMPCVTREFLSSSILISSESYMFFLKKIVVVCFIFIGAFIVHGHNPRHMLLSFGHFEIYKKNDQGDLYFTPILQKVQSCLLISLTSSNYLLSCVCVFLHIFPFSFMENVFLFVLLCSSTISYKYIEYQLY